MSVIVRIFKKIQSLEQNNRNHTVQAALFCKKFLGITDAKSFHQFNSRYELWRISQDNHRDKILQKQEEMQTKYMKAFSSSPGGI